MKTPSETFWDEEKAYDEEISPLMAQIIAICKRRSIPVAATFQYGNREDEGPCYCTTTLPTKDGRTSEKMHRIVDMMQPELSFALAETHVTDPATGRTTIHIRRV